MKYVLEIWKRSPLLRIVVPLIIGVVAADVPYWGEIITGVVFLLCAWFLVQRGINRHWSRSHYLFLEGIFYAVLSAAAGSLLVEVRKPEYDESHIMHERGKERVIALRLEDEPKRTASGWRVTTEAIAVQENSCLRSVRGKVSVLLSDSAHQRSLHADDMVWVKGAIEPITPPRNPGEFDYALYSTRQYIKVSMRAREHRWMEDSSVHLSSFHGGMVRFRERLIRALDDAPMEERERQVLAALVLGKTTELDKELMQAYATAGAVHVLAVSGLHVALIYILLKPIFSAIFGKRRAKWLRWSIPVVLLWLYAALTGFSPSVLRAALMFSCFIVGETYGRTGNIFNTMSASIIILLLVDPMVLYSMGFLLSYLAVLGIVIIQPRLYKWWAPENFIMKKAWELVTISVAAQLATMPVTLYMFHQFPTWFIVTNLVVVPLSTIVLYMALAFFALLWWAQAASFVGGLLGLLTRIMNDMMTWSASWPYALMDGIYWATFEFVCCLWLIILASSAILFGMRRAWMGVLVVSMVWVVHATVMEYRRSQASTLCFFSAYKNDWMCYVGDGSAYTYREDNNEDAATSFNRIVLPFIQSNHPQATVFFGPGDVVQSEDFAFAQGRLCMDGLGLVQVDSAGHCFEDSLPSRVYWFTHSANRLYLRDEHMRQLRGATVILGNTYARKKREWLKKQLGPSAVLLDVSESAVMWEDGRLVLFGEGVR
ncbi:MAG: ComEC/Rec2 family competence protein [Flavobacteriales bacterium]|jgi:competence protein ComEC